MILATVQPLIDLGLLPTLVGVLAALAAGWLALRKSHVDDGATFRAELRKRVSELEAEVGRLHKELAELRMENMRLEHDKLSAQLKLANAEAEIKSMSEGK